MTNAITNEKAKNCYHIKKDFPNSKNYFDFPRDKVNVNLLSNQKRIKEIIKAITKSTKCYCHLRS